MKFPEWVNPMRRSRRALWASMPLVVSLVAGCSMNQMFPVANQHGAGWLGQHGFAVQVAGGADKATVDNGMSCNICHTAEKATDGTIHASKGSSKNCFSCHQGFLTDNPHADNWSHSKFVTDNGGYKVAKVDGKSCSACHTTEKNDAGKVPTSPRGSNVKTCFSCHAGPTGFN